MKDYTLKYKDYHYLLKLVLFAKLHDRRTPEYHQQLLEKLAHWEGVREEYETSIDYLAEEYVNTKSLTTASELANRVAKERGFINVK